MTERSIVIKGLSETYFILFIYILLLLFPSPLTSCGAYCAAAVLGRSSDIETRAEGSGSRLRAQMGVWAGGARGCSRRATDPTVKGLGMQ